MSNKTRKVVKRRVQHSYPEGMKQIVETVKEMRRNLSEYAKDWEKRIENLGTLFKQLAGSAAQQIGAQWANIQSLANSSMEHDRAILALDYINHEIFAQLVQINSLLEQSTTKEQRDLVLKPDEIRATAIGWYKELEKRAFEHAAAVQEAQRQEREEAIKKARAEAEAAAKAKKEEATVEAAVLQAEASTPPEPQGAEIPEGAQVFGGT